MRNKRIVKLLCIFLLSLLIISSINDFTSEAKDKRGKLTVTFNGKTVTLITTENNKKNSDIKSMSNVKEIKNAWKNPKKTKKKYGHTYYYYQKGKTKISFYSDAVWYNRQNKVDKNLTLAGFDIKIKDKNAKLCGVKVGMSKKKALSILKKQFDKKAIESRDDCIILWFGGFMPIQFSIKDGKVSQMSFWCS